MQEPDYGSFNEYLNLEGEYIFCAIHPEMYPALSGISPTGNYFIFCIHPVHGSCSFIVEQDEHCAWQTEHRPPFIDQKMITKIGTLIEHKNK